MKLVVGVTGASGMIYAERLLSVLGEADHEIHLIISEAAKLIIERELEKKQSLKGNHIYQESDLYAPISSGSFRTDGMIIVPASMKTIGSLASGICDNLIARAADVHLKERRPLILVPRETPLHPIHLENMARLSKAGATIIAAMPGFYHKPQNISDLVNFIVGKILDQLGLDHQLYERWSG